MVTARLPAYTPRRFMVTVVVVSSLFLCTLTCPADPAVDALPPNLSKGLRQLIVWHRTQPRDLSATERRARLDQALPGRSARVQLNDDATRTVVDVLLDGSVPPAVVSDALAKLDAEILARYDRPHTGGVLSARLPLEQAEAAARVPGVYSITLVHRPWQRVGKATSQGLGVLRADAVNRMGFDGTGITVGVISDSFDRAKDATNYQVATDADQDILNGDLPGPGNPFGHTIPVQVLADASGKDSQLDEGRAMLQIVHDLAPGARLMFHAAGETPETLAAAITSLRSQTAPACDVIVDDFGFPEEPFFSDGPAALAAHAATASLLLPGHPVVYVSAAGNAGDTAYAADFAPVSNADARAGQGAGNLKLDQVPASLTLGGFHNFKMGGGKPRLAQKVKLHGAAEVSFQWDDPFLPGQVTADYNLLVFDQDGNYLADLSGTDNNPSLGTAVETVDLPLGSGKDITYQFAITRANDGTGLARHLHYVVHGGDPYIKFMGYNHPTTFGHSAGAGVIGVAAYAYDRLAEPEAYSSVGPATIYFDEEGARLATPQVRQQPAVAAVDGVDTSFFPPGPLTMTDGSPGTDSDKDGLPNFFGTSAAAPHVAAVAALMLQAAGGPGSLSAAQVQARLQNTALAHDLDPNFASATLTLDDGSTATLSATADESDRASADPDGFHLAFDGAAGQSLRKVTINLAPTGLQFDPSADLGYAFTVGGTAGLDPAAVTSALDGSKQILTLKFSPGAFGPGASLIFGIDRDLVSTGTDGNSADLLAGAIIKARVTDASGTSHGKGIMANNVGTGYSPAAGYGLVNAAAAVRSLSTTPPPVKTTRPVSGDLLLTSSENHILEIQPDGTQVRTFPVPPDPTNGAVDPVYEHVVQTVVDGGGDLAVLYSAFQEYLFIMDPATGHVKATLTLPDWQDTESGQSDRIVPLDRFVFATYGRRNVLPGQPPLIRFDPASGEIKPFGDDGTSYISKTYLSVAAGPDHLLYALVSAIVGLTTVDVYDPDTLALIRTVELNLSAGDFTVGPSGEFYALFTIDQSILYKLDSNGQILATLALPIGTGNDSFVSGLYADPKGNIVASRRDPIIIDPDFQTTTVLDVFGTITYTYPPTVVATFVP